MKKNINLFLLCFVFSLFFVQCNNSENTSLTEAPIDNVDSSTTSAVISDNISITTEVSKKVSDQKTDEGKKKRTDESQLKKNKCCEVADETIEPCCCEEVLSSYKSFLSKQNWNGIDNLKTSDPFYKACVNKFKKDFEQKLTKIEDEILGTEQ